MAYVYKHTKLNGEPFYIGIGKFKKRAYSLHGRNKHWHNTVNKNGFSVEIICDDVDYNTAKQIERYLISFYGRQDLKRGSLVNKTDGGEGFLNMSKEEKNKRAKRIKEYNQNEKDYSFTQTKDYKLKMSLATTNKGTKKVIDINTNKIFNSQKDAAKFLGIAVSTLSEKLNNRKPNTTSLRWI